MSKLITKGLGDGQLIPTMGLGIFLKIALTSYKKFESPYSLLAKVYTKKPEEYTSSSVVYTKKPETFVDSSGVYKKKPRSYS